MNGELAVESWQLASQKYGVEYVGRKVQVASLFFCATVLMPSLLWEFHSFR